MVHAVDRKCIKKGEKESVRKAFGDKWQKETHGVVKPEEAGDEE